ncbi:MAG: hypothetical protein SFX19_10005 [Alphaproteobacteria bacterium]|nr:hypothetical protein [Alphaproteobacteria bacterium]
MAEITKFQLPADDIIIRMGQDCRRLQNVPFEELNNVQVIDEADQTISGYVAIKNLIWQLEEVCGAMLDYERLKHHQRPKTSSGT